MSGPLIKPAALSKQLFAEGFVPGMLITSEKLEELTGLNRQGVAFGYFITALRRQIGLHGFYFSGEGHNGDAFEILHQRDNHWVSKLARARMRRDMTFVENLLASTDRAVLNELELKRHEAELRVVRLERQLLRRAQKNKVRELVD